MTTETEQPVSTQGFYRYHDVIGLLSPAGPGFSGPVAVTTGPDGMLYVANRANIEAMLNGMDLSLIHI